MILNLANDNWFRDETASLQQIAFSSFRAIEQRLPLLRVAHGGVSAIIDPLGVIIDQLPIDQRAAVVANVASAPTLPAWPERLALAALLFGGAGVGYLAGIWIPGADKE